jgi:hypothetical protein
VTWRGGGQQGGGAQQGRVGRWVVVVGLLKEVAMPDAAKRANNDGFTPKRWYECDQ